MNGCAAFPLSACHTCQQYTRHSSEFLFIKVLYKKVHIGVYVCSRRTLKAPTTRAGGGGGAKLTWSRSDGQRPPEENEDEKTPHDQQDDVQEALGEERRDEEQGAGLRSRSEV